MLSKNLQANQYHHDQQQKVTLLSWFCSTRLLPSTLVCHMAERGRGASPGSVCLVTEPEQPRQASTGLDGCVAEDFSQALGFSTDLMVQRVAQERRLPVHFFPRALDVAERTVLLTAAPGRHRGGIHLLQIVFPRNVLLW